MSEHFAKKWPARDLKGLPTSQAEDASVMRFESTYLRNACAQVANLTRLTKIIWPKWARLAFCHMGGGLYSFTQSQLAYYPLLLTKCNTCADFDKVYTN